MRHHWRICANSSRIGFSFRFYQIGFLRGYIREFDGEIQAGAAFEDPEIRIRLTSNSISTLNEALDHHLSSRRLMSSDEFPVISFISKGGWRLSHGRNKELIGQLRLKSNVDIITLLVTSASLKATEKKLIAQYGLTTTILMSNYGFDRTNPVFGDEVYIDIKITLFAFRNSKNAFPLEKKTDI